MTTDPSAVFGGLKMTKSSVLINEGETQLTGVLLKLREWQKDQKSGCECTILVKNPDGRDTELEFRADTRPAAQGETFTGIFKIGSWKESIVKKRKDGSTFTLDLPVPTLRYIGAPIGA
jgi:hypothetical protein